ncbi:MAG: RNA polymerase sigma-54 factor, partial [Polyangia bacterium]
MSMEIKQHLKLSQQLVMTPQLQQAIKLLQLSRMELVDVVREEMLENPILEDGGENAADPSKAADAKTVESASDAERAGETELPIPEAAVEGQGTQEVKA